MPRCALSARSWRSSASTSPPRARGTGASRALMAELERLASARGAARLILQTGDRQPEAIALYQRIGYAPIEVFEPYVRFAGSR